MEIHKQLFIGFQSCQLNRNKPAIVDFQRKMFLFFRIFDAIDKIAF